ncbi:MAG: HAD-IIIA family hydrolase [Coraliomargarita sp.]
MDNVWLNPRLADSQPQTAVFADRDGTLIRHVDYISDPEQVELLPGVKESIHRLIEQRFPFFILTNQSGVGRGFFPIEQVHACQKRLFELLELQPTDIAGWCIAPEAPDQTGGYRKPSPRFINEACQHLGTSTTNSHMIGDTLVDLETAWTSEAQAWAVECGKPQLPKAHQQNSIKGGPYEMRPNFSDCMREIIG